jgi:hypothetical protein
MPGYLIYKDWGQINPDLKIRIKQNGNIFGNKAANLMELVLLCQDLPAFQNIHVQVPEIFPLSDKAIKAHLDTYAGRWHSLWDEFILTQGHCKSLTSEAQALLTKLRALIQQAFSDHVFNAGITESIGLPDDTLLMVRSSGEEDTEEVANPGGNKSVAAVKLDPAAISKAIGIVAASYLSEKSLTQRLLSGDDISKPSFMPVLLQRMIGEELNGNDIEKIVVSGVMYANQHNQRLDVAPGNGELVVNSKAAFDTYEVTPEGLVHMEIYKKNERLVPVEIHDQCDSLGTKKRKLVFIHNPPAIQNQPSISPLIAKEIAEVGTAISSHYNMPMDVEFVYQPHDKILYLVQARPIQQHKRQVMIPSAIAPEHFACLKGDNKIDVHVITNDCSAAKICTSSDQVIVDQNISMALRRFLESNTLQEKTRAVIIKEDAPTTSHEAAFFNSLAIPVLQGAIEKVRDWQKAEESLLIMDPQHNAIVNWTDNSGGHTEDDLINHKIIRDGKFVSTISTKATLLPSNYPVSDTLRNTIAYYLECREPVISKKIYHQLLKCMDQFEHVQAGKSNEAVFASLRKAAVIFRKLGTSTTAKQSNTPNNALLQHAILTIAEIHQHLVRYSAASKNSAEAEYSFRYMLDAVAKLKALVINPGKPGLFSDSILQIAIQNKMDAAVPAEVTGDLREYAGGFLQLNGLALNESLRTRWTSFVTHCCQSRFKTQLLAQIICSAMKYHFESDLINQLFAEEITKHKPDEILAELYSVISQNENTMQQLNIMEIDRTIKSWESKIDCWSNPDKFQKLYEDYMHEVVPLIERLSLADNLCNITKSIVLKHVERLAQMIDKTIKKLKGSNEYEGQGELVVKRFVMLLSPYCELMKKWMGAIDDSCYEEWNKNINRDNEYNSKTAMINIISEIFAEKSSIFDTHQLEASGSLVVSSARVGTAASFKRQFVNNRNNLTQEDLFSLMHQNILSSVSILSKDIIASMQLPEILQPVITTLQSNGTLSLQEVNLDRHLVSLRYNIPLKNHSMQMKIEYLPDQRTFTVKWGCFGENWHGRMFAISEVMRLEGLLLQAEHCEQTPYNFAGRALEGSWKFNETQIPQVSGNLSDIIRRYSMILSDSGITRGRGIDEIIRSYFAAINDRKLDLLFIPEIRTILTDYLTSRLPRRAAIDFLSQFPFLIALLNDNIVEQLDIDLRQYFTKLQPDTLRFLLQKISGDPNSYNIASAIQDSEKKSCENFEFSRLTHYNGLLFGTAHKINQNEAQHQRPTRTVSFQAPTRSAIN